MTRSVVSVVVAWNLWAMSLSAEDIPDLPVLGRMTIREPLGVDWPDEWITLDVKLDTGGKTIDAGSLRVFDDASACVPAQFYDRDGKLLQTGDELRGRVSLQVLLHASLKKNSQAEYRIVSAGLQPVHTVSVESTGGRSIVSNGRFEAVFDVSDPLPANQLRGPGDSRSLATFHWPDGAEPTGVTDRWVELGPARAILRRRFAFSRSAHQYEITFTFRAGDPWIDVTDEYAFDDVR